MLWVKLHRSSLSSFANLNCIVGTKLKNKKYFKFSWWSIIRWLTRNQFFSLCVCWDPLMVSRCRIREFSHRSAQKFLPPSITILYYIPGFRTDIYLSLLHIAGVRWLGQGTRDASLRQYYERLCRSCGLTVNSEKKWSQLWLIWLCLEYFLPFYTIPMRNRLINQVWFRIHLCLKL